MTGKRFAGTLVAVILVAGILALGTEGAAPRSAAAAGSNPPALCCMGFAYMPAPIDKIVMYGGLDDQGIVSDQTWTWDPAQGWLLLIEDSLPGPRSSTRMTYDAALGKIVLFGGKASQFGPPVNNETWMFDGTTWTSCSTCTVAPPARISQGMDYYPGKLNAVVLFGGQGSGAVFLSDTWILKGASPNWVPCPASQCPAGTQPSARISPTVTYDGANRRLVLFGGQDGGGPVGDTWFFTTGRVPAWTLCPVTQCPVGAPSQRFGQRALYDTTRQQIMMFGAGKPDLMHDSWFWNGKPGAWVQCGNGNGCPDGAPSPAARCCVGLAYDEAAGMAVLYGGAYDTPPMAYADTWTWDSVNGWVCASDTCSQ